jgi:chaperonin GroES
MSTAEALVKRAQKPRPEKVGFSPIHDWIVVSRDTEEVTEGGIVVLEEHQDKEGFVTRTGTVVAVGPGPLLENNERPDCQSEVGRRVCYQIYKCRSAKIDGVLYDVVRDGDVLGHYD